MALLSIQQISKAFGGPLLLDQATLQIERNERIFMVGRNGEGKSTLLKIIAGELESDAGSLIAQPGLKIRALQQNVPDQLQGTIEDLVRSDFNNDEESWETQRAIDRAIGLIQYRDDWWARPRGVYRVHIRLLWRVEHGVFAHPKVAERVDDFPSRQ